MAVNKENEERNIKISDDIDYEQKFSSIEIKRMREKSFDYFVVYFVATIAVISSISFFLLDSKAGLFEFFNNENEVEILIVDQNGEPIEKAQIIYINDGFVSTKSTNISGFVKIKNIKSSYKNVDILIKKEGFKPTIKEIRIDDISKKNKIFKLEK